MNQDKSSEKLLLYERWRPPTPNIQDPSDFNTEGIFAYLESIGKIKEETETKLKQNIRSRGAPKKKQRLQSTIEKSADKKKQQKQRKSKINYSLK